MAKLSNKTNAPHYTWGGNCDSWVYVDTEGLSIKHESMPPQTKEKLHVHSQAQQFFFVLKGIACFYLDNEEVIVSEQNGIHITPGTKHFIANENNETLDFLVISQPTTIQTELPLSRFCLGDLFLHASCFTGFKDM